MKWFCEIATIFCLIVASVAHAENGDDLEYQFKGVHFFVSYCDCDREALSDVESLKSAMTEAVNLSGASILESSSWIFPPSGLTMVFLLSESHASIHTYPEHGACFVDLFTCGEHCSAEQFDAAMRAYLKPKSVNHRTFIRNEDMFEKDSV